MPEKTRLRQSLINGLLVDTPSNADCDTFSCAYEADPSPPEGDVQANDNAFTVTLGGSSPSVLLNDTFNGAPATTLNVVITPGIPSDPAMTLNPDGTIDVPADMGPGVYEFPYTICQVGFPSNCDTAIATITAEEEILPFLARIQLQEPESENPPLCVSDVLDGFLTEVDIDNAAPTDTFTLVVVTQSAQILYPFTGADLPLSLAPADFTPSLATVLPADYPIVFFIRDADDTIIEAAADALCDGFEAKFVQPATVGIQVYDNNDAGNPGCTYPTVDANLRIGVQLYGQQPSFAYEVTARDANLAEASLVLLGSTGSLTYNQADFTPDLSTLVEPIELFVRSPSGVELAYNVASLCPANPVIG